jgi:hypothetical protein
MSYRRERYATGCSKKRSCIAKCERQYSLDPVDSKRPYALLVALVVSLVLLWRGKDASTEFRSSCKDPALLLFRVRFNEFGVGSRTDHQTES